MSREAVAAWAAPPAAPRRQHLPALDGLRGIAVLLVLWDHAPHVVLPEWTRGLKAALHPGNFGVDLFFVLSGFLITRILLAEREEGVPVRYFLLRRAARIFPIYYLLLLAMALLRPHPEIKWCAVYLSNFYEVVRDVDTASWLRHTWSLCVEEHFYACWPLLVTFLPTRLSRRVVAAVVIPGAIASGIVLLALPAIAPVWSWIEGLIDRGRIDFFDRFGLILFGTQCRVLSLAVGALFAFHEETIRRRVGSSLLAAGLGLIAAVLVVQATPALCTALEAVFDRPFPLDRWRVLPGVVATSLATSSLLLLLIATESRPLAPTRLLAFAPLRGIGRISYGLYLYHLPLFQYVGLHRMGQRGEVAEIWLAIAALFGIATLSYFVIERPILRWAARFRFAPPGTITAARAP